MGEGSAIRAGPPRRAGKTDSTQGHPRPGCGSVARTRHLARPAQADWPTSLALRYLGRIRRHQGQLEEARRLLEEGVALRVGQWGQLDFFQIQTELARLLVQQGELAEARALYEEHRAVVSTSRKKDLIAYYLEGRAVLEVALGAPKTAIRLWGAAEALRRGHQHADVSR